MCIQVPCVYLLSPSPSTVIGTFATHGGQTKCHRGLKQLSQVTIKIKNSPPPPEGGEKIHGLNVTETKKKWVEKFKSPIVSRTKPVGRIATRTKRGWTKCQGSTCLSRENHIEAKNLKIFNHFLSISVKKTPKQSTFFTKNSAIFKKNFSLRKKLKKMFLWILPSNIVAKNHLSLNLLCLCYFLQ